MVFKKTKIEVITKTFDKNDFKQYEDYTVEKKKGDEMGYWEWIYGIIKKAKESGIAKPVICFFAGIIISISISYYIMNPISALLGIIVMMLGLFFTMSYVVYLLKEIK